MSIADDVLFEDAIDQLTVDDINPTTNEKRVNYITDQNNGSYSGEITFDATPLVGGDTYIAWKEAFIQIPFKTTLTLGAEAAAEVPTSFAIGIKNGWYQFIDSISVYVNGKELVSQTPYSNMIINAMQMMKMTQDELQLKSATLGLYPDDGGATLWSKTATSSGDGFYNNRDGTPFVSTLAGSFFSSDYINDGMRKRQSKTTAFTPTTCTLPSMNTPAKCKAAGKNYHTPAAKTTGTEHKWHYLVNLPLNVLSDLFEQYPLVKGGQVRIVLRYNAGTSTMLTAAAALSMKTHTQTYGHTQPIMVASAVSGGIGLFAAANTSDVVITTAVSTDSFNITSARLYATSYRLNPQYEARLLSSTPKKEIRYLDVFNQNVNNITNGSSVNQILTTSITNPKFVIVMPFANTSTSTEHFAAAAMAGVPCYQSLFDTAPSTTLPYGVSACANFQVNVANKNMFNSSLQYNFESFQEEIQKIGLNGGIGAQCSGLLDVSSWNFHNYMVCDVSRRLIEDDGSRKSVSVSFTNSSGISCDYVCFILYEKVINVDLTTGDVERLQ